MTQPIYKLWFGKPTAAYYQLSKEEKEQLRTRQQEYAASLGVETILQCESAWASEQWQGWGVEKYPDLEALQKLVAFETELQWYRYVESTTILGTTAP